MPKEPARARVAAWLVLPLVVLVVGLTVWGAGTWLPGTPFLSGGAGAEWILYRHVPRAGVRPAAPLVTTFRKQFALDGVEGAVRLEVRAFRDCRVRVNDRPVALGPVATWKRTRVASDLAGALRVGANRIEVEVLNDRGPPALWLLLGTPRHVVGSDATWEASLAGAAWQPARPAAEPLDAAALDPALREIRPIDGLRRRAGRIVLIALAVVVGLAAAAVLRRRIARGPAGGVLPVAEGLFAAALALAWAVLFWNNAPSLWYADGFDAETHLEYVQFVLDQRALPRADQGWSMFQPPLFYLSGSALLVLSGISSALDPVGVRLLRLTSFAAGLAHLLLLWAGLRLVFPEHPRRRWLGLGVAAFLPMHLYLFQSISNEPLAAASTTGSLVLGLYVLRPREAPPAALHAALGLALGAAMLARFSAFLVVVVLLGALAARRLVARDGPGAWWRSLGVTAGVCGLTCGWHYAAVWSRFGHPFVGNWDPAVLPPWWQDPGFVTPAFFTRFGQAFALPLYSGLGSYLDGMYATLWGDGLLSGRTQLDYAPPWDLELMAAGYLLALVPMLGVLVGLVAVARRQAARPETTWLVLAGVAAVTVTAVVVWPVKVPLYSVIKAFFAMPAVLPLIALAAVGLDLLAGSTAWRRALLLLALATWALAGYSAFWIPRGAPRVEARLGWFEAAFGDPVSAERRITSALGREPENRVARMARAELKRRLGDLDGAIEELRRLAAERPEEFTARLGLARLLEAGGRPDEALREYRRAAARRAGSAAAQAGAGRLLLARGAAGEAITHLRRALAAAPEDPALHADLARALRETGDDAGAARHESWADSLGGAAE